MKTFLTAILFLITFNFGFSQKNTEFRSTWIITWEYISSGSSVEENKARIRNILDNMNTANMSSVLWQARQNGTAYYNSSYEPWGSYAGGSYPGFDPLQYAIEEAHKRGLEIHVWMNTFESKSTAPGTPANLHPEWICRDQDGYAMTSNIALSPGLPDVRTYTVNVAMEIVRNYDIDGLHLDYVRWNEYSNSDLDMEDEEQNLPDGIISDSRLNDLKMNAAGRYLYDVQHPYSGGIPSGFSSWEEWWRWSVTEFVRVLHDSIQSAKPYVKLSCAALGNYNWGGWNGYSTVFQDAALWFNMGYVDQIAGMHYHWLDAAGFLGMLVNQCPACWSQYIQPGVAAGRLFTVGPPSYQLHEYNLWHRHPEIVNAIRSVAWVDGFQFFSYGSWRERNYFADAGKSFLKWKTKQRKVFANTEAVPAPQISISKIDSFHYNLTVTPPALDKPYWFAVYRSETAGFSRDTTNIISVKFADSVFTIQEAFDGLQDFNGSYRYSATMLNRYWKESELSNIVATDPVPSNPPFVVSTNPVSGDTVVPNITVTFNFSKSINQTNLQNYFKFTPEALITNIYSEPKRVVITTAGLENNTSYTVRVDSLLKDINGRMLDGNNDGIEGDPFYLNFVTFDVDTIGPSIVNTSPLQNDSLDVEDVISFVYNEPLLKSSITNRVTLFKNGVVVPVGITVTNFAYAAVINLKPTQGFSQNADYYCVINKEISDTAGNQMSADFTLSFKSRAEGYSQKVSIDEFTSQTGWEQPGFSGSTTGIMVPGTAWGYTSSVYLPSTSPRVGGVLSYKWDPDVTPHLIREYLSGGPARDVVFDTSFILQVYIHGDGSGSRFRFALDEGSGGSWPNHEVSLWNVINWYGWKLVEWDLGNPALVGTWIGNNILDGTSYRIDSFQLTDTVGSASEGILYFDNLRIAKKTFEIVSVYDESSQPVSFNLYQNYPNPFNPFTTIRFDIETGGKVNLEVFDILGRKVKTLISDELQSGHHELKFDASELASGQYIYRLVSGDKQISRMMVLMK